MHRHFVTCIILLLCAYSHIAYAQNNSAFTGYAPMDLNDVIAKLRHNTTNDTPKRTKEGAQFSFVPAAGYTLQTGLAAVASSNVTFKVADSAPQSSVAGSFTYTIRNQIIVPILTYIATKNEKYVITGDWRYLKYPSYTYGLGGYTQIENGYMIDYSTIRLHQAIMKKMHKGMYLGMGYEMDYFWNIKEINPPAGVVTDYQRYGLHPTEFASGITFNMLLDSRKTLINPLSGHYLSVVYRPNLILFGNTTFWRSLVIDARKYIRVSKHSENVLALWNYYWLTLTGKAPYPLLPNTGGDAYSNTGRGYIQGRYRGSNMLYAEAEYRFGLTHNGLLGGVVFANWQSFSEETSKCFENIAPGWGGGLRIKLNKYSRTNIAIDYGFGLGGTGGLFVNLAEVF